MGTSEVKLSDNPNSKPTKAYSFSVKLFQKTAYKPSEAGVVPFLKVSSVFDHYKEDSVPPDFGSFLTLKTRFKMKKPWADRVGAGYARWLTVNVVKQNDAAL